MTIYKLERTRIGTGRTFPLGYFSNKDLAKKYASKDVKHEGSNLHWHLGLTNDFQQAYSQNFTFLIVGIEVQS